MNCHNLIAFLNNSNSLTKKYSKKKTIKNMKIFFRQYMPNFQTLVIHYLICVELNIYYLQKHLMWKWTFFSYFFNSEFQISYKKIFFKDRKFDHISLKKATSFPVISHLALSSEYCVVASYLAKFLELCSIETNFT